MQCLLGIAIVLAGLIDVEAIMFQLHPNNHKCLVEKVHAKTLVTGEYEVTEFPGQVVDFQVRRLVLTATGILSSKHMEFQ